MSTSLSTPRLRMVPQAGPAAWTAAELTPSDWMVPIGAEAAAELEAALAALGGRQPARAEEVSLPRLGPVLADLRARLAHGRGFALLRGVPLDRFSQEPAVDAALLALGVHLGEPLAADAASAEGPVAHLAGAAGEDPGPPRFHADPCDTVALLWLSQPPSAAGSTLVSAAAAHNELLKRDRALLEELYRPLPHAGPGEPRRPVFAVATGGFSGRYDREAIEAAGEALTAAQRAALDLLDAVCTEPELPLRIETRPGDLLCFSPPLVWKRRIPVRPGPAREFLRLRLTTPHPRGLAAGG